MNKFIERFAEVQGITYKEAEEQVGAATDEEILENIQKFTTEVINQTSNIKLNRAQRRALAKKAHRLEIRDASAADTVIEAATKLNYISLIQELRKLNEKNKETEENDTTN